MRIRTLYRSRLPDSNQVVDGHTVSMFDRWSGSSLSSGSRVSTSLVSPERHLGAVDMDGHSIRGWLGGQSSHRNAAFIGSTVSKHGLPLAET
jgi:hypothetical protein